MNVIQFIKRKTRRFREKTLAYKHNFKNWLKKERENFSWKVFLKNIFLGVLIESVLLYFILKLWFSSVYPRIIVAIIIGAVFKVLLDKKLRKELWKFGVIGMSAILSLQVVTPVFVSKVDVGNPTIYSGSITTENGIRRDFIRANIPITIQPPLFPNTIEENKIKLALGLSNITYADYSEITLPSLFSKINIEPPNSASFYIYADGWKYNKLETTLFLIADKYPLFSAGMKSFEHINPNSIITIPNNGGYSLSTRFYNNENFPVCFQNFDFKISNKTYIDYQKTTLIEFLKNAEHKSYSVNMCNDYTGLASSCAGISKINGNQTYILDMDQLDDEITFTLYHFCINPNSTIGNYLILNPIR